LNKNIRSLLIELEQAREAQICRLADHCDGSDGDSAARMRDLVELQTALVAVREVLADHEPCLGYGSETPANEAGAKSFAPKVSWSAWRDQIFARQ
jgi:hypothetical protein